MDDADGSAVGVFDAALRRRCASGADQLVNGTPQHAHPFIIEAGIRLKPGKER
ncbi:MAG TPA: hypothetical protein VK439_16170 [Rubrivivax sp.]|nr:hypothetical protein [Rubrivivax sp.]